MKLTIKAIQPTKPFSLLNNGQVVEHYQIVVALKDTPVTLYASCLIEWETGEVYIPFSDAAIPPSRINTMHEQLAKVMKYLAILRPDLALPQRELGTADFTICAVTHIPAQRETSLSFHSIYPTFTKAATKPRVSKESNYYLATFKGTHWKGPFEILFKAGKDFDPAVDYAALLEFLRGEVIDRSKYLLSFPNFLTVVAPCHPMLTQLEGLAVVECVPYFTEA